jgi:hypothetical protein
MPRVQSVTDSYGAVLARLRSVLGVAVVTWGVTMLLPIIIVGIPFAINLMVRWTFDLQAAVIEDLKTREALGFSSRLVKGFWWQIGGVVAVIAAFLAAPGFVMFFLLPSAHPALVLLPSALTAVLAPFLVCLFTLLFFRLRERFSELAPIPVLP